MHEAFCHIRAGWLLDGSGSPPRRDVLLSLTGGRFATVRPYDSTSPLPAGPLTDLSSCTILPPLVDCHVHLALSGILDQQARQAQRTADFARIRPLIADHLRAAFAHGVLAVRDGGDAHGHALRFLRESEGDGGPARVTATGRAWHQAGRYGGFLGRHPAAGENLPRAYVQDQDGGDQVKVINSGSNSLHIFARQTPPQFTGEELAALVRLAAAKGKKVMVHANGELPVRLALEAGCHSIEHGYFMGRANLELMAKKGAFWVPTLVPMDACARHLVQEKKDNEADIARRTLEHQLEQVALARELGVTIALGTDAGSPGVHHGAAVGKEFRLLCRTGLSPAEAVRCASWHGAQLLGAADHLGLIAPARPAHFLVLRGTPDQLPATFPPVHEIYLHGRPCLSPRS